MYLMMKMNHLFLLAFLWGTFESSSASPSWSKRWHKWPGHDSHHDYGHHGHSHECRHGTAPEPDEYQPPGSENGCSCLVFVGEQQVFGRADAAGWYSCSGLGLYRCSQFCDELFQDENLRYRSRQDACDTIGREIFTPWYRKNQVCGVYGPFEDIRLNIDLCCRRGRTSGECADAAQA